MTIEDFLIRSTIKIVSYYSDGSISTGTGFFYNFVIDNNLIPVIVTNNHVIENSILGELIFSLVDDDDNIIDGIKHKIRITDFSNAWILHPDKVDICILPLATIYDEVLKQGKKIAFPKITDNLLPNKEEKEEFMKIEDVYVIGYPDGIIDEYNNLPIVRRGITATPIMYDFKGKTEFLIDVAIYGGSSGSPVYVYNKGIVYTNKGINFGNSRLKLVGIVYGVYQHTVDGEMKVIDVPTSQKIIPVNLIPNNLGCVIKSERLNDFIKILKQRLDEETIEKNEQIVEEITD